jgi:hypothetical protein
MVPTEELHTTQCWIPSTRLKNKNNGNKNNKQEKKGPETDAYMVPTEELHTTQCWIPSTKAMIAVQVFGKSLQVVEKG